LRAGSRIVVTAVVMLTAVATSARLSAHRRDEILQAARIAVEPTRVDVELDLTPGIGAAESMIAAVDSDGDGLFSLEEQRAYAARVLGAVVLQADGQPLQLEPAISRFALPAALRRGEGIVQLRSSVLFRPSSGVHHIHLRNTYQPELSVYLANAMVPESDRISVTAQHRDPEQRELTIDYVIDANGVTPAILRLLATMTMATLAGAGLLRATRSW